MDLPEETLRNDLDKIRGARRRLDSAAYRVLCEQVLVRDGWSCQFCGSRFDLHVHHIRFRSQGGPDREENLITLCAACHRKVHEACAEENPEP